MHGIIKSILLRAQFHAGHRRKIRFQRPPLSHRSEIQMSREGPGRNKNKPIRNALKELALIDNYLLHQLNAEETQNVETSILLNSAFAEKVEAQRIAHRLI